MTAWFFNLGFSFLCGVIAGYVWLDLHDPDSPMVWLTMPIAIGIFFLVSWALAPRQHKPGK